MQNLIPCRFHIEVEAVLKSEGLRATKQRLDIWDELSSNNKHRDIETILLDLKNKKINVSRATLYRTIDVFVKHDLLKKITLETGKFLYEHNKKTISPKHDHIVCEDCGEIFEFFDNNISSIEQKIADDLNLKVTKRVHQLSGSCKDDQCSHAKN
ncbi:MAG: Fur family transcriptional regulator [Candidatus Neomarinimicrobiota bacterium]